MVLMILVESDLVLSDDVVETIVDKVCYHYQTLNKMITLQILYGKFLIYILGGVNRHF